MLQKTGTATIFNLLPFNKFNKSINLKNFAASVFSATPTLGRQFSSTTRRDPTGVVLPVTMPQAYVVVGGMKRVEKLNAVITLFPRRFSLEQRPGLHLSLYPWLSTFLDNLMVLTMCTIYFLNAYHQGWPLWPTGPPGSPWPPWPLVPPGPNWQPDHLDHLDHLDHPDHIDHLHHLDLGPTRLHAPPSPVGQTWSPWPTSPAWPPWPTELLWQPWLMKVEWIRIVYLV